MMIMFPPAEGAETAASDADVPMTRASPAAAARMEKRRIRTQVISGSRLAKRRIKRSPMARRRPKWKSGTKSIAP